MAAVAIAALIIPVVAFAMVLMMVLGASLVILVKILVVVEVGEHRDTWKQSSKAQQAHIKTSQNHRKAR